MQVTNVLATKHKLCEYVGYIELTHAKLILLDGSLLIS